MTTDRLNAVRQLEREKTLALVRWINSSEYLKNLVRGYEEKIRYLTVEPDVIGIGLAFDFGAIRVNISGLSESDYGQTREDGSVWETRTYTITVNASATGTISLTDSVHSLKEMTAFLTGLKELESTLGDPATVTCVLTSEEAEEQKRSRDAINKKAARLGQVRVAVSGIRKNLRVGGIRELPREAVSKTSAGTVETITIDEYNGRVTKTYEVSVYEHLAYVKRVS